MPRYRKDGTQIIPQNLVIDDLTYRTDISRQRKRQIRYRREHRCVICGTPLFIDENGNSRERCGQHTAKQRSNRKGLLQGREERIDPVEFDVEGLEP